MRSTLVEIPAVSMHPILVVRCEHYASLIPPADPQRRVHDPEDFQLWSEQMSGFLKRAGGRMLLECALQTRFESANRHRSEARRAHWALTRTYLELACPVQNFLYLDITPDDFLTLPLRAGGRKKFFVRGESLFGTLTIEASSSSVAA